VIFIFFCILTPPTTKFVNEEMPDFVMNRLDQFLSQWRFLKHDRLFPLSEFCIGNSDYPYIFHRSSETLILLSPIKQTDRAILSEYSAFIIDATKADLDEITINNICDELDYNLAIQERGVFR
jgi:hypothetical protein